MYYYNDVLVDKLQFEKSGILTDIGCSICGIRKSKVSDINANKTWNAVNALPDINSLYMFYKISII